MVIRDVERINICNMAVRRGMVFFRCNEGLEKESGDVTVIVFWNGLELLFRR